MNWLKTHGSTVAMILVVLGMVQSQAGLLSSVMSPTTSSVLLAVAGALVKLIQSLTGTTSAAAPNPPA